MSHAEAEIRRRGAVPDEIEEEGPRGERGAARSRRVSPTRSTSSNMPAPGSISAPITIARRSSPMTARNIRPTPWTATRRRPCRAAARRISGARTAARSTTRWGPSSRCCGSIRLVDVRRTRSARRAKRRAAQDSRRRSGRMPRLCMSGRLVLSRPDQHVAWRGDSLPPDPLALIDRVRGAATQAR